MRFSAGGRTEVGPYREANEDHLLIDRELGLAAVFDAGGSWADVPSPAGPMAADIIQRTLRDGPEADLDPGALIERAFRAATERLRAPTDDGNWGWGASISLALVRPGRVFVSWLGDAMVHRVTGDRVEPVTRPHTAWNEAIRRGIAPTNPGFRKFLVYVLGGELPDPLEVISFEPHPGDRIVLTTNGITDHIADGTILNACRVISDPTTCAEAIIEHAFMAGSRDNCTCAVIAFENDGFR
jgi:protein phosphatase